MAKNEATLLGEIVSLLRKQNQLSTRDRLREAEEAKRQEKLTATTESGISMSEEIQLQGVAFMDRFVAGQAKTAMDRLTGDKPTKTMQEVGNTLTGNLKLQNAVDFYELKADIKEIAFGNLEGLGEIEQLTRDHLPNIDKWTSLVKANSDVLVWDGKDIKHGIQKLAAEIGSHSLNVYDAEADADADAEQARWGVEDKQRKDDLRSAEEARREGRKNLVDKNNTLIAPGSMTKISSRGGLWKSIRGLPLMLVGWALTGGVLAIKDFITGWKEDGFAGAVGKMLGGSGEGLWNSIKQAFKVGGLGAMIGGAIGFLFGGIGAIPGAIIGGLIGMALGAIFGYIGGDKITAKLKEAGAAVALLWGKGVGFIMYHLRRIGEWFYSPGQSANPHVSGKTEIFGGFISWDPGNFSIKAMWDSAISSIWGKVKEIGKWFWDDGKAFGGRIELPTWDEIFGDFKQSMANMWNVIANIPKHIKRGLMSILPDWMLKGLGWIKDAPVGPGSMSHLRGEERAEILFAKDSKSMDPWFGDSKEAFLQLVNSGQLGATNAGQLDGNLVAKMTNFDEYANWIGPGSPANNALLMAEQKRKFAALGGGQRNIPAPVIITDSGNDKSSQTIIQYINRAPAGLGNVGFSGNSWMAGLGHNIADAY